MLAFTMQFSKHERTPTHNHHQQPTPTKKTGQRTPPAGTKKRYGGQTGPHAKPPPTKPRQTRASAT
jgi:hypothetical protein